MADILIRDVAPNLKRDIESRARAANRSLSDEVKHLLRVGLAEVNQNGARVPGETPLDAMRRAFAEFQFDDTEHAEFEKALDESRRIYGRTPPDGE